MAIINSHGRAVDSKSESRNATTRAGIIDHTKVMNQYIRGQSVLFAAGLLRGPAELSIGKQTESG